MEKNHQETPQVPQVDATRRRLTKAGLAVPAVLGTLASRQVLADAFNCTPSGQISGNVSRPGAVVCSSLGTSPANWISAAWPSAYVKGTHNAPDQDPRNWGSGPTLNPSNATLFKAVFGGGVDLFKFVPVYASVACNSGDGMGAGSHSSDCKHSPPTSFYSPYNHITGSSIITSSGAGWSGVTLTGSDGSPYLINGLPATLQEVLASSSSDALFVFAKAAIATLLSATTNAPSFPVTASVVIAMFNDTYNGTGTYQVNDSVSWNRSQVLAYFQSLYQ